MIRSRLIFALWIVLCGLPVPAATQQPAWLELNIGTRWTELATGAPGAEERLTGPGFGAGMRARLWRMTLDAGYDQGRVEGSGATPGLDVVEGAVALGFAPIRWLRLEAGPQIRALVRTGGTERWVLWTGRMTAEWRIAGDALTSFASAWRVLGANVNTSTAGVDGHGMTAGLVVRPPRAPFSVRAGYRVDRLRLDDGSRRETMQGFFLDAAFLLR